MVTRDSVYIDIITETKKSVKSLAKYAAAITAAIMVAKKLAQGVKEVINAYGEQERAEKKLVAAIKATGRESQIASLDMYDLASALQGVTTHGDEATISAMAMLQQLANLDQKGLTQVTPLVLDFADAMGVDLETAASLVGKTLGSTTNALSRYGIVIDATAPQEQKLAELTAALTEKFGGMSKAMADTALGSMKQLSNAFGDLKESIGFTIVESLKPVIEWLTTLVTKMKDIRDVINDIAVIKREGTTGDFQRDIAAIEERIAYLTEERTKTIHPGTRRAMRLEIEELQNLLAAKRSQLEVDQELYLIQQANSVQAAREAKRLQANAALLDEYVKALEEATKWQFEQLSPEEQQIQLLQQEIDKYAILRKSLQDAGLEYAGLQNFINALVTERDKLIASLETEKRIMGEIGVAQRAWAGAGKAIPGYAMPGHAGGTGVAQRGYVGAGKGTGATPWTYEPSPMTGKYAEQAVLDYELKALRESIKALRDAQAEAAQLKAALQDALIDVGLQAAYDLGDALVSAFSRGEDAAEKLKNALKSAAIMGLKALAMTLPFPANLALYAVAGGISGLQEGGVVTKPTLAMIGERGPEAVVPLNKSGGTGGVVQHFHIAGSILTERQLEAYGITGIGKANRGY